MKGKKIKKGKKGNVTVFVNKKYDIVDSETGEVIEQTFLVVHKKTDDMPFAKIYPALTSKVMQDIAKNRIDGAVQLLFLIAQQIIDNNMNTTEFYLHPKTVCEMLGITKDTFYRWRNILMKLGYFKRHPEMPGLHWYVFNPFFLFKGNMKMPYKTDIWKKALIKEKPIFERVKKETTKKEEKTEKTEKKLKVEENDIIIEPVILSKEDSKDDNIQRENRAIESIS